MHTLLLHQGSVLLALSWKVKAKLFVKEYADSELSITIFKLTSVQFIRGFTGIRTLFALKDTIFFLVH